MRACSDSATEAPGYEAAFDDKKSSEIFHNRISNCKPFDVYIQFNYKISFGRITRIKGEHFTVHPDPVYKIMLLVSFLQLSFECFQCFYYSIFLFFQGALDLESLSNSMEPIDLLFIKCLKEIKQEKGEVFSMFKGKWQHIFLLSCWKDL